MERVRRIWEVELTAVLEIQKVGHRRRILASVAGRQNGPINNIEDLKALNTLVSFEINILKFTTVKIFRNTASERIENESCGIISEQFRVNDPFHRQSKSARESGN